MSYTVTVDAKNLLLVVTAANETLRRMPEGAEGTVALRLALSDIVAAGKAAFNEERPFTQFHPNAQPTP